jgi:hypothetical protein
MSRTQNTQFPQQFRTFTKSLSEHPLLALFNCFSRQAGLNDPKAGSGEVTILTPIGPVPGFVKEP